MLVTSIDRNGDSIGQINDQIEDNIDDSQFSFCYRIRGCSLDLLTGNNSFDRCVDFD